MNARLDFNIRLLQFALRRCEVSDDQHLIALDDTIVDEDDRIVLRRSDVGWEVYYCERGQRVSRACFDRESEAIKGFFWRLTNPTHPWSFREEFEREVEKG